MSEVIELLKVWMEEIHKQELRHEEEWCCYEQERADEKRHYGQEWAEERLWYKELERGLTTGRSYCIEVRPESLKLTNLAETDDIEAFLMIFERAVKANGVERDKSNNSWSSADMEDTSGLHGDERRGRSRLWQSENSNLSTLRYQWGDLLTKILVGKTKREQYTHRVGYRMERNFDAMKIWWNWQLTKNSPNFHYPNFYTSIVKYHVSLIVLYCLLFLRISNKLKILSLARAQQLAGYHQSSSW